MAWEKGSVVMGVECKIAKILLKWEIGKAERWVGLDKRECVE